MIVVSSKPVFEDHPISTQTLIISTNLTIDCPVFFEHLTCHPVATTSIARARAAATSDVSIPEGAVVFAQYKNAHKGTAFKRISDKYFLNSVTVVIKIQSKFVNIKVSNKGKLQITGCNQQTNPQSLLKHFWALLEPHRDKHMWSFQTEGDEVVEATVIPVMCNINFSIDFQINREALNTIINTQTSHVSILEPSDGYVGVNIKIHMKDEPMENILVDQYRYVDGIWEPHKSRFMTYMNTLSPKEQKKKMSKCYVNTFLVFYSGKVIMSGGISTHNRKRAYEAFMEIIEHHRERIQTTA
jgi:TATA-box binding protein (TBP) (component of TFIID and TFIIIB)